MVIEIESIIFISFLILQTLGRGIDMELIILLIISGLIGALGAFFSLHGARQKDVGYDESHKEFLFLIEKAQHEILIATDLDSRTFDNDAVLHHLQEARKRGVDIRLIFDRRAKLSDVPKLAKLHESGVILTKRLGQCIDMHFVVIDGQHVRIDKHPFQQYEDGAEGRVLLRTLELGRKYRHQFDVMWGR